jgi:hypothetical protein
MNCPMRLGLSNTTCPQRLQEQNPIKVVFVLYDSKPSRSPSHKSPVFLLVYIPYTSRNNELNNCKNESFLSRIGLYSTINDLHSVCSC